MAPPYLLGLDCGLTVTKAVVHDLAGRTVGGCEVRVPHETPRPRWVERNGNLLWRASASAIRGALNAAGAAAADVEAVGITGYDDGLYLVDDSGGLVRPAILSMDTRAVTVLEVWQSAGIMERALRLTGQVPWPATPAALLAWLLDHEPDVLARATYALGCKDFVKLRLTGRVSTDPSEASLSFTDVRTQGYSAQAFALYGLSDLGRLLPSVVNSAEVAGFTTHDAAAATGLRPGTPVISGIHDVDACAIATGAVDDETLSVIAGSFSINQVVSTSPVVDARWSCRNFGLPGRWTHMAVSPASATNLEWFVTNLGEPLRSGSFQFVDDDIARVALDPRDVWYLPFLYGSPVSAEVSGAFVGLRGWHGRAHLVRALLEGVVFNHRMHVEALRSAFPRISQVRLSGGGSRSDAWVQMFADGLGYPVVLTETEEAGALGAAMCAGIGAGIYSSLEDATRRVVRQRRTVLPSAEGMQDLAGGYARYGQLIDALRPFWEAVAGHDG